ASRNFLQKRQLKSAGLSMDRADGNSKHVYSALLEHAFSVVGSTFLDCSRLVLSSKLTNFALDYRVKGMRYFRGFSRLSHVVLESKTSPIKHDRAIAIFETLENHRQTGWMVEVKNNWYFRPFDHEVAQTGKFFNAAVVEIAVEGLH